MASQSCGCAEWRRLGRCGSPSSWAQRRSTVPDQHSHPGRTGSSWCSPKPKAVPSISRSFSYLEWHQLWFSRMWSFLLARFRLNTFSGPAISVVFDLPITVLATDVSFSSESKKAFWGWEKRWTMGYLEKGGEPSAKKDENHSLQSRPLF